jgi:hypothetical protein
MKQVRIQIQIQLLQEGPTIVNARWGVPDEKEVDVTQSFIDIFKNNHSSYILYDHNPNQFNELEEDPLYF